MEAAENPGGADSGATLVLDAHSLKGLTHPLRLKILVCLLEHGPATPTMLARMLGESSGSTSYHLRQLAEYGFIQEDANPSRKERWWRAAHRSTLFDERMFGADPQTALVGAEFLRAIAGAHAARTLEWIDTMSACHGEWRSAGTVSDWALRLSRAELDRLQEELLQVVGRYRQHDPEAAMEPGTAMVTVQMQILPRFQDESDNAVSTEPGN